MKKGKRLIAMGISTVLAMSSIPSMTHAVEPEFSARDLKKPNIIFVMADDTGAREFGCYGNTFNETPIIDELASEGTLFNQYYSQPLCSPARSCLMTGNNTLRTGISNFLPDKNSVYLDPDEFETLPQVMNRAGYHTGMIGKWHLSAGYDNYPESGAPAKHGWDEVLMSEQKYIAGGDYFFPYFFLPQVTGRPSNKYLVDDMNEEAVKYIERNKEEPFMLYISHYATHTTLDAPAETVNYFQNKRGTPGTKDSKERNPYLAAMLKHMDDGVGMIVDKLDELGIRDNTILVVTSDNGGDTAVTVNGELRGGKGQLYEGGIRDPMIISWPDKIKTGKTVDFPTSIIDFYQTFAEAGGLSGNEIPVNRGVSLMPILNGTGTPDRDTLYWVFPKNTTYSPDTQITNKTELREGAAIRKGNYKYIESLAYDSRRELYDLSADPTESNNIIDSNKALSAELARELHENLEKDTIGKVFQAGFADNEYYRWLKKGDFSKTNGVYSSSGDSFNTAIVEDFLFYDAEYEIVVKSGLKGRAGILFRSNFAGPSSSEFKSYAAVINQTSGTVELLKIKGDIPTVLASKKVTLKADTNYRLKVVTDSDEIKLFLDGTEVLKSYDESLFKGTFGVISEHATSTFDNLKITGIKGNRSVTAQQLNVEPDYSEKVKIDGKWITFDNEPQVIGGELFVQADRIVSAIGANFTTQSNKTVASYFGDTVEYTVGSSSVKINGTAKNISQPPKEVNGHIMIPLSLVLEAFSLESEENENVTEISTAFYESFMYNSPRIKYTGTWTVVASTNRSTKSDGICELDFNGIGIKLYLDRGNGAGICDVYIDGVLISTVDAYNPSPLSHSLMFEKLDLTPGNHTIKVANTGTKNSSGVATNINISEFQAIKRVYSSPADNKIDTEMILDSNRDRIKYVGNWTTLEAGGFGGTTTRSSVKDEYCEIPFEGFGIRLYLGRGTGAGIFDVYIDGVKVDTIDSYNPDSIQKSLMYENLELAKGKHTIKIVNTGNKNVLGTSTNINIDAFEVLSNTDSSGELENADYSKVDAALSKIPTDLSIYTDASVTALNLAKNAVVQGKDKDDQTVVDGYASAIENAIKNLIKKTDDNNNGNPPDTGDNEIQGFIWVLVAVSLCGIILISFRRRYMNKNLQ